MLCDRCHNKEAVVHMTQIVNGRRSERHLCRECAAKENVLNDSFGWFDRDMFRSPLDNFFRDPLMGSMNAMDDLFPGASQALGTTACPNCGKTYEEFQNDGLLGCPDCYEAFRDKLRPAFERAQGAHQHEGKRPEVKRDEKPVNPEVAKLQKELDDCVVKEDYEKACQIRDQIKKLENEPKKDEGGDQK